MAYNVLLEAQRGLRYHRQTPFAVLPDNSL